MNQLKLYLENCYIQAPHNLWSPEGLEKMANQNLNTPFGMRGSLLQGDANGLIARWLVESFIDLESCKDSDPGYAKVFSAIYSEFKKMYSHRHPVDEIESYTKHLARQVHQGIRGRINNKRTANKKEFRQKLIDEASGEPRCYLCGFKFDDDAIQCFLDKKQYDRKCEKFVDFMMPHGLNVRDFRIELDHVYPFALGGGGEDNLKMACGWCNRYKSSKTVLYEAQCSPKRFKHPTLGVVSRPQPLWAIRAISTRQRCEFSDGCDKYLFNSKLTVAPLNPRGGMLPSNLQVVCDKHDPISAVRRVPAEAFLQNKNCCD